MFFNKNKIYSYFGFLNGIYSTLFNFTFFSLFCYLAVLLFTNIYSFFVAAFFIISKVINLYLNIIFYLAVGIFKDLFLLYLFLVKLIPKVFMCLLDMFICQFFLSNYLMFSLMMIIYAGFAENFLLALYLYIFLMSGLNPYVYLDLFFNPLFCLMYSVFGMIFLPFYFIFYFVFYIINFLKVAGSFLYYYSFYLIPNKVYYSTGSSGGGNKYPPLDVKYVYSWLGYMKVISLANLELANSRSRPSGFIMLNSSQLKKLQDHIVNSTYGMATLSFSDKLLMMFIIIKALNIVVGNMKSYGTKGFMSYPVNSNSPTVLLLDLSTFMGRVNHYYVNYVLGCYGFKCFKFLDLVKFLCFSLYWKSWHGLENNLLGLYLFNLSVGNVDGMMSIFVGFFESGGHRVSSRSPVFINGEYSFSLFKYHGKASAKTSMKLFKSSGEAFGVNCVNNTGKITMFNSYPPVGVIFLLKSSKE